jgi:adenylate kinase family enzyme
VTEALTAGPRERPAGAKRIAIIGNSGSGKTYLAHHLAALHRIPALDLDTLFWLRPGDYTTRRPLNELAALVQAERRKETWIVEGVYGELVEPFLGSAQQMFWLDLPWRVCFERIESRQKARGFAADSESFNALVRYAAAYWQRADGRSHAGHGRLFDAFVGEKHRFTSTDDLNEFLVAQRHA